MKRVKRKGGSEGTEVPAGIAASGVVDALPHGTIGVVVEPHDVVLVRTLLAKEMATRYAYARSFEASYEIMLK